MPNLCVHPDCGERLDKGHIACRKHWALVDGETVKAVMERLRGWKNEGAAREYLHIYFLKQLKG